MLVGDEMNEERIIVVGGTDSGGSVTYMMLCYEYKERRQQSN